MVEVKGKEEEAIFTQTPLLPFVDASGEDVVGETYKKFQTHVDSVHVEGTDSPSVCPEQDVAVDLDSLCSTEQLSSSYVYMEDKQSNIDHPCEVSGEHKDALYPLEDNIVTKNVSLNESPTEQDLQQVYVVSTVSRSMKSNSKSCITRENGVFQKLLRRCRYFDCTNGSSCIEDNAFNSSSRKLEKPCYVCGQLRHNGKRCPKRRTCCTCKKRGHIAEDCPMNNKEYNICLKCGDSGHELSTCDVEYSTDDLQKIQCYVCNELGHICCGDNSNTYLSPETASCYKCGESGHPGLQCPKPHLDNCALQPPSICYKCGEGGHVARKCRNDKEISGCHTRQQASEFGAEGDENRKMARRRKTYRHIRRKQRMRGLLEYTTVS